VTPVATTILSEVSFAKRLDCTSTMALVRRICERVEASCGQTSAHPLARFVVIPSHLRKNTSLVAQDMLDETWDCAESPQFARALTAALDRSLNLLGEQLEETLFSTEIKPAALSTPLPPSFTKVDVQHAGPVCKPLPSLLVQLKPSKTVFLLSNSGGRSVHADAAASLPEVGALCRAVFGSAPTDVSSE